MASKRIEYLDIAKGIGIVAVIMGHTYRMDDIKLFIYAFHVPIFFFISGLFFNPNKNESFIIFIKNKTRTLLLPYFTFYVISYLYWLIIERHYRPNSMEINIFKPIAGLFYGTDWKDYMIPNGALWFLSCLFSAEVVLFLIFKVAKRTFFILSTVIILAVIGYFISINDFPRLPLSFNSSLLAILFIYLGYLSKEKIKLVEGSNKIVIATLSAVLLTIMYLISSKNGMIDMDYCVYRNPFLFVVAALLGITGIIFISKILNRNLILQYFGLNSLILFGLSEPIKRAVIGVLSKVSTISIEHIRASVIYSIVVVIMTLLIISPVIIVFNRYLYKIIGKKVKSNF